ncbi:ABC transporter substrate-binding protein [Desulfomarina sp.]
MLAGRIRSMVWIKLFFLFLSVCLPISSVSASPPVFQGEKLLLRVGYVPIVTQLPLIMSFDRDRFAYQYVEVRLVKYRSFTALEAAFRISAVDVAMLPLPIILAMDEDDIDVKIIGSTGRGGSGLFVRKKYSGFKGAIIGIPDLYSNEHFQLIHFLAGKYLKYGTDYKVINIPLQSLLNDLFQEKIDGAFFPEPYPTLALDQLGKENGTVAELSRQYSVVYSVLAIKGNLLIDQCRNGVLEWLKSVRSATFRIAGSISFYGGEQEAVTQMKYFGFDRDLFRKSLEAIKGGSYFRFENINMGFVQHIGRDMHRLQLLTVPRDLNRLSVEILQPDRGEGRVP